MNAADSMLRGTNGRRLLAVSLVAAALSSVAATGATSQPDLLRQAVVEVVAVSDPPDPAVPWRTLGIERSWGSGVVIDGHRILTAAHVVAYEVKVTVKRFGTTEPVDARVLHVDSERDLALLAVESESFFDGTTPLHIGDMPRAGDRVEVLGFPIGGKSLSVTAGIVSRVEISSFADPGEEILLAQIDAAINSGNSGGPIVAEGKLVGIATSALDEAENVGYIVPVTVVRQFLDDVTDGVVNGVPELGVDWQAVENETLRDTLGLEKGETGGLVTRVDYGSTASEVLEVGDVILTIDGLSVAQDLTQKFPEIGRVDARYASSRKQVGDKIAVRFLRGGQRIETEAVLRNVPPLVHAQQPTAPSSYCILGGLVFRPLTKDYLDLYQTPPHDLASYYESRNFRTPERSQIVLLATVLPGPVSRGYDDFQGEPVARVNGTVPRDLSQLVSIVDSSAAPVVEIVTENGTRLTLDAEKARAATKKLLKKYGIPRARSAELPQERSASAGSRPGRRPSASLTSENSEQAKDSGA